MANPSRVLRALERLEASGLEVALLPGVSLDMLLQFEDSEQAFRALEEARASGNGDVHPVKQLIRPGGGTANTALALARVGVCTHVLARTSPAGARFLEATLEPEGVDVSRIQTDGVLTATAALELQDASIMITEQDGNPFGPTDLSEEDRELLGRVDAVVLHDWANPHVHQLAEEIWALAKEGGGRTYTDTSDPPGDSERWTRLVESLSSPDLDAVSVNDRELRALAPGSDQDLQAAGEALSREIGTRVDLHSMDLTASFENGRLLGRAPRFEVTPRQVTGAGDTWDAGNILGDLLGLDAADRLLLANAFVALYVNSEDAWPGTAEEVKELLMEAPQTTNRSHGP